MVKVGESFFKAMAVLSAGGRVRNKNWSENALYVEKESLLNYPVPVFCKKIKDINGQSVIERMGWSPSLADLIGEWEILEDANETLEDTFGYTILQLFDKTQLKVKHKNWSGEKVIEISEHRITATGEKYYTLHLCDRDTGKKFDYFPTVPDILRKGWSILRD